MKPISDVVPLAQWIQKYHSFRARLDLLLYRTGYSLTSLHHKRFGAPTRPGVWTVGKCVVYVGIRTLSVEVPEDSSVDAALAAFDEYQKKLFLV